MIAHLKSTFQAKRTSLIAGTAFGLAFSIAQSNLYVGLPIALITVLIAAPQIAINSGFLLFKAVLIVKILWTTSIWITLSNFSISNLITDITPDLILVILTFIKIPYNFLKGSAGPITILIVVDLLFNLWIHATGTDPIGRSIPQREGDILPRVGGVFGHAFLSVNLSIIGVFSASISRSKTTLLLSILNLCINGTFRSPLALALTATAYILTKFKFRTSTTITLGLSFVALIVIITITSATIAESKANQLRLLAWTNAITNISKNPILGNHTFETDTFESMSPETIIDYGIAESIHLQTAVDYGIPASALGLLWLVIIVAHWKKSYKSAPTRFNASACTLATVIFIDSFYGTLFNSGITNLYFGLILLSTFHNRPQPKTREKLEH